MASVSFLQNLIDDKKVLKTCEEYDDSTGNTVRDAARKLFRRILSTVNTSKNTIEIFDDWVDNGLPRQIESQSFGYPSAETRVEFTFSKLKKPTRTNPTTNTEEVLLPNICRQESIPYLGELYITVDVTKKGKTRCKHTIACGKIPIMLGSKRCHLYNKTPEQLLSMGECIADPFGYFIISSEMSLITQEKPRTSLPIVFNGKNGAECKFTTSYTNGTKIVIMVMGKKWNTIKVKIPTIISKDKLFPIFSIYHFLLAETDGDAGDVDEYKQYILKYVINLKIESMCSLTTLS